MKQVFADTAYWIALLNPRDELHKLATHVSQQIQPVHLITTDEVLVEFLAFFRDYGASLRAAAVAVVRDIMRDPNVTLVPQTRESFANGLSLYDARQDKAYSLTDCISMETMKARGITDVLTSDHHFEQEGFTILLAEEK